MSLTKLTKSKLTKLTYILFLVIIPIVTSIPIPAFGYDQNNPAQYTINYIISGHPLFAVYLCGAPPQTTMDFNTISSNAKLVEPTCQSKNSNQPWANITNQGNVNLNISIYLNTPNPSWVDLYITSNPSMTDKVLMTNISQSPSGWLNIAPTNTVQLYSFANFTNAPVGTNSTTMSIKNN